MRDNSSVVCIRDAHFGWYLRSGLKEIAYFRRVCRSNLRHLSLFDDRDLQAAFHDENVDWNLKLSC